MSFGKEVRVSSATNGHHAENDHFAPKNSSVPSVVGVKNPAPVIQVEKYAFLDALGHGVSLDSVPVIKKYEGDLDLDCDGVTNLAASMILALNFDKRLATGHDPTRGKSKVDVYGGLKIMSKKLTRKPYDFHMKLENMEVGELLGNGRYGTVWNTTFKGRPAALKEIDPVKVKSADLYKERDLLVYLKNEYVCGILGAWYQGLGFFLLEQCIGNLIDVAKNLSDRQRFFLCVDLLEGLDFVHSKGIIHCNIQPESCLVKHGIRLCIGNFGRAQILPKDAVAVNAKQNLGCIGYQEAVTNKYFIYSKPSDVFSAACIIYELTTNGSHLLRYSDSAVANADDYITAFQIGRRTCVVQTRDITDEKLPRETLRQRVHKSKLGNVLAGMIRVPWTDRFSTGFGKLHPDITDQIAAYQSEKVTNAVEPLVCVNEDVRFVRPKCTMPDEIGIGWHVKAFACLYYDAESINAQTKFTPHKDQVRVDKVDDGISKQILQGINNVQRCGAASGKNLRKDDYDNKDDYANTQTERRKPCDAMQQEQMSVETRTKNNEVGSTGSVSLQEVKVAVDVASTVKLKNVNTRFLAKLKDVETSPSPSSMETAGESQLLLSQGVSAKNQTETANDACCSDDKKECSADFNLSTDKKKCIDSAPPRANILSPKNEEEDVNHEAENVPKSSTKVGVSNGGNLAQQNRARNSKPATITTINKKTGLDKNEDVSGRSSKHPPAKQNAHAIIVDGDHGDRFSASRKIAPPLGTDGFANNPSPGGSKQNQARSNKSHTRKLSLSSGGGSHKPHKKSQSESDGISSSQFISRHILEDVNLSSSRTNFTNVSNQSKNDTICFSKSDDTESGSLHSKSSKKPILAVSPFDIKQKKSIISNSSYAQGSKSKSSKSNSSKSNYAGVISRHKREHIPFDDHMGAGAPVITGIGKSTNGVNVESETKATPNKEKKAVPAPEAMVSGFQKRPLPPSASAVKSKKARREEENGQVDKVVYTHGCSFCDGKFTSKQNAKDHQHVCTARHREKII